MRGASLTCILAFAILSDDHPIEILRFLPALSKWGGGPGNDACWPDIDILVVVFPDR